ncbi:iron-containing redox enzyme family protein [Mycobacterium sp. KBS0706]|uniref:iron-containing redox enzyme family protein n=1 Tax=Mycobacterium sp. KBS0706 TaxID=2578109 RepID=UPI00110F78A5|nr:iron-containing redox enzyme family protein [Mycobacterium sp. KBS0706]TSD90262.1 iron-containing redox enzyme family protein [Mycobacterium sp. KBS0706]
MGATFFDVLHAEAVAMVVAVRQTRSARSLLDGSAGIATYANTLREAYHCQHAMQPTLALAAERMLDHGRHMPLALLLQEKAREVAGLDLRVLDDLEALGFSRADVVTSIPAPPTQAWICWLRFLGRSDHPAGFLGIAYLLEYLAATCAGTAVDGLLRTARIAGIRRALSFLRNRVEAREGHVRTLAAALPALDDPAEIDAVLTSARVTRMLYAGMLRAVDGMSAMPARRVSG